MAYDAGAIITQFKSNLQDFKAGIRSAKNEMDGFARIAKRNARTFKQAGLGLTAFAGIVGAVGYKFAEAAGQAEDTQGKFEVVFSGMQKEADAFVEHFSGKFDMAESSIQEWMATLKDTFDPLGIAEQKSMKWGKQLTALALDVKTFYPSINSVNDAINRFTSYLVGNHEAVREMGVVVNEAMIKQQAYKMGIAETGEELSEVQKMTARYELLLNGLENAQGNATRELDNFNTKVSQLKEMWKAFREEFGEEVLPMFSDFIGTVKDVLKYLKDLPDETQRNIAKFVMWSGIIAGITGPLSIIVGYLAQMGAIISGAGGLTAAIAGLSSVFTPFLVGGAILAGIGTLVKKFKDMKQLSKDIKSNLGEITSLEQARKDLKRIRKEIKQMEEQSKTSGRTGVGGVLLEKRSDYQALRAKERELEQKIRELEQKSLKQFNDSGEDGGGKKKKEEAEKTAREILEKDIQLHKNRIALNEESLEQYKDFLERKFKMTDTYKKDTLAMLKEEIDGIEKTFTTAKNKLDKIMRSDQPITAAAVGGIMDHYGIREKLAREAGARIKGLKNSLEDEISSLKMERTEFKEGSMMYEWYSDMIFQTFKKYKRKERQLMEDYIERENRLRKQELKQEKLHQDRVMQYRVRTGDISLEEYKNYLEDRRNEYKKNGDQWIRLSEEIRRVQNLELTEQDRIMRLKYKNNEISLKQYKEYLQKRLEAYEEYSEEREIINSRIKSLQRPAEQTFTPLTAEDIHFPTDEEREKMFPGFGDPVRGDKIWNEYLAKLENLKRQNKFWGESIDFAAEKAKLLKGVINDLIALKEPNDELIISLITLYRNLTSEDNPLNNFEQLLIDIGFETGEAMQAFNQFKTGLVDGFTQAITQGKNLVDVLNNIINAIAQMIVKKTIVEPTVDWLLGSMGMSKGHQGAYAGAYGLQPIRLHSGAFDLKSNEIPAILEEGESVLTSEQTAKLAEMLENNGNSINIYAMDSQDVMRALTKDGGEAVAQALGLDYSSNGQSRDIIKGGN